MNGWTIPYRRRWVDRARRAALVGLAGVTVAATAGAAEGRDGASAARAYVGEYGDDLREKTGGLLDRIAAPRAFLVDPAAPLPIERRPDFLEIAVTAPGDVRLIEAGLAPREDRRAGGKTKT